APLRAAPLTPNAADIQVDEPWSPARPARVVRPAAGCIRWSEAFPNCPEPLSGQHAPTLRGPSPRSPTGARAGPDRRRSPQMYERFTDRARKVMQLANQEAQRFNHEYIGTEHILLGLVKEGSGVAANVLKNLDVDLRKIRLEVEKIVQTGPGGDQVVLGKL